MSSRGQSSLQVKVEWLAGLHVGRQLGLVWIAVFIRKGNPRFNNLWSNQSRIRGWRFLIIATIPGVA